MTQRIFGHIPGIDVGTKFSSRDALYDKKIHMNKRAGITGAQSEGADSIVISGGYEDDEDYGDIIIYTGHGGRDENTGKQIADQLLKRQNLALAKSMIFELPVRVTRSLGKGKGYRYDGLYYVKNYWNERGKAGYIIWRFELHKAMDNLEIIDDTPVQESDISISIPGRTIVTTSRIKRKLKNIREIKELYDFKCQICNIQLKLKGDNLFYAEAAHIKPLGKPHNGPDEVNNMLCLCPNHHVLLDNGAIWIDSNLKIMGITKPKLLTVLDDHKLKIEFLNYHKNEIAFELEL
ncbi:hypothetical protein NEF87_000485 [Candidatus Lokiarchaeum ossiferum]|uniref:YDG domain-containing protein n=1 Tax=Candidatus Lokiarchaeum ossiferum TaxID=2951803 RepID=A0ABY6HL02_9ARCH|nr:hypothetical protein NEF87_000485 [Candidatus Lokiarchaeum sp. B-35]